MSQRPAYDQIIQGLSGMMSITGTPETAPLRVGFPVCDTIGGLAAAMAINAALVGRARTGRGHFIDVSMLEASLSAMGWVVSNYLIGGRLTEPMGDQNFTAAPSGTFRAADGPLNIAGTDRSSTSRSVESSGGRISSRMNDSGTANPAKPTARSSTGNSTKLCVPERRWSGKSSCRLLECPLPGSSPSTKRSH